MNILVIDGIPIGIVTKYSVKTKDVEAGSSGETESGHKIRDVVRTGVHTIDVTLTGRLIEIRDALKVMAKEKLSVQFFDPNTANIETAEMFKQSDSNELYFVDHGKGAWESSFTLEEF